MTNDVFNHPATTPWGHPETVNEIAPGIVSYSTPSHGGYWLSPARVASMPKPLRDFGPWAGPNWYEEDCDWCIVALAYPHFFPADWIPLALATLQRYEPELLEQLAAIRTTSGRPA